MFIENIYWWLIISINLLGYFIFRFGIISRGAKKDYVEFLGGVLLATSFVSMFFVFGIKATGILVLIFWLMITPIIEITIPIIGITIEKIYDRLFKKTGRSVSRKMEDGIKSMPRKSLDDMILNKTLRLLSSSNRTMPAYLTNNGERKRSFCIDFKPLSESDDYKMASESWYSVGKYISKKSNLSSDQINIIIRCGEDIMVGAFIITKLNRILSRVNHNEQSIEKMIQEIFRNFIKNNDSLRNMLLLSGSKDEVLDYFDYCEKFGRKMAEITH